MLFQKKLYIVLRQSEDQEHIVLLQKTKESEDIECVRRQSFSNRKNRDAWWQFLSSPSVTSTRIYSTLGTLQAAAIV